MRIHCIDSMKFKSNCLSLYIHQELNRNTVTMNSLIPSVLRRGTSTHPTMLEFNKYAEELYGANIDCGIRKKGNGTVIYFTIKYIRDKYIGEDITRKIITLLKELVFLPYTENGVFSASYVRQEKENLRRYIDGLINDKKEYVAVKLLENMFPNDPYGIFEQGFSEDLDSISEVTLFEHYKDILNNSGMDLFYSGDINGMDSILADEFGKIDNIDIKFDLSQKEKANSPVLYCEEIIPVNQSKLCMGLICNTPSTSDEYFDLMMCNAIFGSGTFSKLFLNVREKLSLAYYVYSRVDRLKGVMTIGCGIEHDKYDAAYNEIMYQLNEIKNGNISDYEIDNAKKYITSGLRSMQDSMAVMEDYTLSQIILNQQLTANEFAQKIMNVNKNGIQKAAKRIELDTIYLLKGTEKN